MSNVARANFVWVSKIVELTVGHKKERTWKIIYDLSSTGYGQHV